jgi:hypothetical protein
MSEWGPRLSQELGNLQALFHPNELAYLALTQKIEHAIRDRLAFCLHRKWAEQDSLLVCREWNHVDVAVMKDSLPVLLLEAKAQYTFDILKKGKPHDYPDLLLNDIKKVSSRRNSDTEVFTLLLVTHPHGAPDHKYRAAVKYFPGVTRGATTGFSLDEAKAEIDRRLIGHPQAATDEIKGGNAFGVAVSVAYWLFGPYPNNAVSPTVSTASRRSAGPS